MPKLLLLALIILLILLIIVLVFMAGPRVVIDETIHPISIPEDLDRHLEEQEKAYKDIIPGTEKKIIWDSKPGEQTDYAVVYLHGFSATRQETAPLADRVANRLKANLFYTRMTGHGRTGKAMLDASVNAWLKDTMHAYEIGRRLGKKVIMIGVSTGGTALTWLATQPGNDALKIVILISPNFGPADKRTHMLSWPWGQQIAELAIGKERKWTADNPEHERYWTTRYPTAALLPMMGMVKLVSDLHLGKTKTPVLVIYSPEDQVVDAKAIAKRFTELGSERKKIIPFRRSKDSSQHVLAGDILSPNTTETVSNMIHDFVLGRNSKSL